MADKQSDAGKGGAAPKTARKAKAKTARKSATKPNGSSAGGRDSVAELEAIIALTSGDLDRFVERAKVDVSFVHDPDAIAAVNKLEGRDRVDLIGRLKEETEVRIGAFEDALRKAKGAGDGSGDDGMPGRSFAFAEIEPWPDPVNGAELLTDIANAIGKYVVMDPHQRAAAALGAMFSHTHDLRDTAPIFFIVSPTKRCGKTRLERVIKRLARKPVMVSNAGPAPLARIIEKHHPTLLIDEFDAMAAGNQEMGETLRGQLNSSFDRDGANIIKCVPFPGGGWDEREFSTWSATWIAGIRKIPDTVEDRSVVVRLRRKLASEKVARFRGKDGGELDVLRRKIARFVADNEQRLRDIEPDIPKPLDAAGDRAPDAWEPLFAIADVAGGSWPKRARDAALALCKGEDEEDAERNVHAVLLADIRDIFARLFPKGHPAHNQEEQCGRPDDGPRLLTKQLLDELHGIEERPWVAWGKARKPLTDTGLASLLRSYEIHSSTVRSEDKSGKEVRGKGYFLSLL